jgi:hypothetical protein
MRLYFNQVTINKKWSDVKDDESINAMLWVKEGG